MTDRTVRVSLTAQVSGYIAGMERAALATRATGSEAQRLAQRGDGIKKVGTALFAIGAVAAAGVGLAIKAFSDFDVKMSQVKTLSHATAGEMDALSMAALTMGQKIGFSATQTADAEIELVKAGVSVANIMGGALKGSLELAAAGQIDVGKATEIATIALTQFGLKGKDVPHVADLLAAGADKALGGVGDLGEALKSGGLVASQFGLTLDDTVGTLSAFANAGLLGETAGTDLRQMLLKLGNPSVEAAKTMKNLGINLYDTSGKFVGITNLSGQLKDKLSALTPEARNSALAIIFGSRAIAGANVLYKEGATGIKGWIDNVNDSGFAAQQARGKMDNLQGDITKLGAAFQTDMIESGSAANGVLRGTVQTITNLTAAFAALPPWAQGTTLAVGVVVAVVGLLGGGLLLIVPKILAMKAALLDLSVSMRTVGIGGGAVGLAITALVTVLALVAGAQANAAAKAQAYGDTLDAVSGKTTKASLDIAKANLSTKASFLWMQSDSPYDAAKKIGLGLDVMTQAAIGNKGAMTEAQAVLKRFDDAVNKGTGNDAAKKLGLTMPEYVQATLVVRQALKDETAAVDASKAVHEQKAEATGKDASSTDKAATAYKAAADQAKGLADQVSNLTDQINTANGVGQDAVSANAAYGKALAAADDTIKNARDHVKGYSMGIDESTVAGSANADMLGGLAKASEDAAKKQLALDGDTARYQATLAAGRQAVIDRALALGATAAQAQALADKVAAIPTEKDIKVLMDTNPAQDKMDGFVTRNDGRRIKMTVDITGKGTASIPGLGNVAFDGGGYTGDGGKFQKAGVVHRAEFVSTKETTAIPANRAALEYMHGGGVIKGYEGITAGHPAYAAPVQYASPAAGGWGVGGNTTTNHRGGDTFQISSPADPVGVAQAVQRRQNARGAV